VLVGTLAAVVALVVTARWGVWSPLDLPFNSNAPMWAVYGSEGK
jgi:hypothetical protein